MGKQSGKWTDKFKFKSNLSLKFWFSFKFLSWSFHECCPLIPLILKEKYLKLLHNFTLCYLHVIQIVQKCSLCVYIFIFHGIAYISSIFNSLQTNTPFIYSLKTTENQRFSVIFRGYRKETLTRNRLRNFDYYWYTTALE